MSKKQIIVYLVILVVVFGIGIGIGNIIERSSVSSPAKVKKTTVLSPNGGEKWELGNKYLIRWIPVSSIPKIKIYLVPANPDYSIREIDGDNEGIPNTGSFSWYIPHCYPTHECSSNFEIPTGKYYIKISNLNETINDQSDNYFSIVKPGI